MFKKATLEISILSVLLYASGFTEKFALGAESHPPYDIVIRGGKIVDGSGAPWFVADVGVRNGRIVSIGRLEAAVATQVIDAKGLVVAPGFIDMMGQTATPMWERPETAVNLLTQGITTINAGEGGSAAPLNDELAKKYGWQNMAEYFQLLDLKGLPVNVAQTVGLTQIREIVIGEDDRRPTDAELERMKGMVQEAMEAGAIGVSTALIYPPAVYATKQEIAALAEVAGNYGGRYYTHMRNEGQFLLEAIDEAIAIGRDARTPVHIYHLKAAGRDNWRKMPLAIERIKAARSEGQQVTADIYPYEFNGLGLEALIHPRHFTRGREAFLRRLKDEELRAEIRQEMETTTNWENWYYHAGKDWGRIVIGNSSGRRYAPYLGQSVAQIAEQLQEDPWDTFFDLVQAGAFALPQTISDANIADAIREEFISFCTDVGPASDSPLVSHPRSFGAFPRLLSRYVRDKKVISLERAVSQASAVAANEIMAYDRGRISIGAAADLIVFDYEQLQDKSTAAEPRLQAEGMKYVIVNGVTVLKDGRQTEARPGRVLRGPGYKSDRVPSRVITGEVGPGLEGIDRLMQRYLAKHLVPGASLAITDHGRLIYARGFGYADVGANKPVQPESLFRIASITKPLTAVAIMQLVEAGKLDLDAPVYEILDGYEPYLERGAKLDERQNKITIRHLLQHRGGWDRDVSFDAMFQSVRFARALGAMPPAGHDEIIRCMRGVPLDFEPGERFAYSNYGYCLLGRVIEKLTGQSYDEYVKEHVLAPVGIRKMTIGATRLAKRHPSEVRYYDPNVARSVFAADLNERVPTPYGAFFLESMDSHGAWIASATDLVRFASALDDAEKCPLLSAKSVQTMFNRPPGLAGFDKEGKPLGSYYCAG
ncbi:MAG: serine hydrolase, partial [Pirellulales bacterium]